MDAFVREGEHMEEKVIGRNIARYRKERGLTQTQMAEFLCVTPQTISKWETENGAPDITLLPKIALFLEVSIDDLFGISNINQVEDLVLRYSVLRQEHLYQEAMRALEHKLSTVSAETQEQEYYKLQGLKTHLFVQNAREKIKNGMDVSREMLERIGSDYEHPWYLPFKLQLTLFHKMDGDIRECCRSSREQFEKEPNEITLRILCETLMMFEQYEQIAQLFLEDKVTALLREVNEKNKDIFILQISVAAKLDEVETAERLAGRLKDGCDVREWFDIQWMLADMYQEMGNTNKLGSAREELLVLLERIEEKEYIKERYREQLMKLLC